MFRLPDLDEKDFVDRDVRWKALAKTEVGQELVTWLKFRYNRSAKALIKIEPKVENLPAIAQLQSRTGDALDLLKELGELDA
jgi:hypothetical protein